MDTSKHLAIIGIERSFKPNLGDRVRKYESYFVNGLHDIRGLRIGFIVWLREPNREEKQAALEALDIGAPEFSVVGGMPQAIVY